MAHKFLLLNLLGVFLLTGLFNPHLAFAKGEFATSYDVVYEVQDNGTTLVTQKGTIKNLTSQYFASNYTLSIGSTTVSDVTASDQGGAAEVKVEQKDNRTAIAIKFNQQVVGVDKAQIFTLKFKSQDFAQSIGKTWEVNLPKIPPSDNLESYDLALSVPVSFGEPTSVSPTPKSQSVKFNRLILTFTKDQLEKSGVSANFGLFQIFDFTIKYQLENTSFTPVLTNVTLPPDTQYQDILLAYLEPTPTNVTVDQDGNYLAWYKLSRDSKTEVIARGSAKLYINSKNKTSPQLSLEGISRYTQAQKYWEKDSPVIKEKLREIFRGDPPKTNREKVRLIYRYVVDNLSYNGERLKKDDIERLGALTTLNNPQQAVCMEFTDLFIALSRAAGIPARELDGFAYSQNKLLRPLSLSKDFLHAWPEYYDESRGWVMIDPTWENTSGGVDYFNKFDLNHLVLAIKGSSSERPTVSDSVKVIVSGEDFISGPKVEVEIKAPETLLSGLPNETEVKIANVGNSAIPSFPFTATSDKIRISGLFSSVLPSIPPYGFTVVRLNLKSGSLWDNYDSFLSVSVGKEKFTQSIEVRPFFLLVAFPYVMVLVVVILAGTYGLVLLLHLSRQPKSKVRK